MGLPNVPAIRTINRQHICERIKMKKLLLPLLVILCSTANSYAANTVVAQWNFNSLQYAQKPATVAPSFQGFNDANSLFWRVGLSTPVTGSVYPQTEAGNSWYGRSSDPTAITGVTTYAAFIVKGFDVLGDKFAWKHSTVGYKNIYATFDYRTLSSSMTPYFWWMYSIDGGNTWTYLRNFTINTVGQWQNGINSAILPAVCNNQPNLAIAVQCATSGGSSSASMLVDMLNIVGERMPVPVPEPSGIPALLTGIVGLAGVIRRRVG